MEAGLGYLSSKTLKALEFGLKNEYPLRFQKHKKAAFGEGGLG
jgi:hypothetical protein